MPKRKKVKPTGVSAILVISKGKKARVLRGRVNLDLDGDRKPDRIVFYRRERGRGHVANVYLSTARKKKKTKKRRKRK